MPSIVPPKASLLGLPLELRDMIFEYLYCVGCVVRAAKDCAPTSYDCKYETIDRGVYQPLPDASILLVCRQLGYEGRPHYEKAVAQSWDFETDVSVLTNVRGMLTEWHHFTIELEHNPLCSSARFASRMYRMAQRRERRCVLTVTLLRKGQHFGSESNKTTGYHAEEFAVFGLDMDVVEIQDRDKPLSADCALLAVFSRPARKCIGMYGAIIGEALVHLKGAAIASAQSAKSRFGTLSSIRACLQYQEPEREPLRLDQRWSYDDDEFELANGNDSQYAECWASKVR
ncbi:hypothetical protein LTR85_005633 [Meristemomyces frigidus]|nr:hypothetical protein LTR85_005633 [Meristemomyces frigidus]